MLYLVGNPEYWFSHNKAHMNISMKKPDMQTRKGLIKAFEPRSEKTGLRGFPPGSTQPGLYSYRRWLEA